MATSRVLSLTNPLRSQLIEPSQYLENIKQIINVNQEEFKKSAENMKESIEKLDANIDLVKDRVLQLETAKTTLDNEIKKNEQELTQAQDTTKLDQLQQKNQELQEEKSKIEAEINAKLNQINELESAIQNKENEWNQNKKMMVDNLKDFQDNKLIPYLNEINEIMSNTNASIQASNTKLLKILSPRNEFGADPFVSIGAKFQEKLVNTEDLFEGNGIYGMNSNHFGKVRNDDIDEDIDIEDDEDDEDDEEDYEEMQFGNDSTDDEEDDEEDDEDEEGTGETDSNSFGSDEESSESNEEEDELLDSEED
jgi:predicted  nucleic acid-binding Zn-ribbon protein